MPFLRALKDRSMFYAVDPIHQTGSSDADFAVLTGTLPNGRIAPYKVLGFPYTNTLPQAARAAGFSTISIHGYSGNFFARRPAFNQMGFTEILFADDLVRRGCPLVEGAVDDDEVLRWSSDALRQTPLPIIHFIITFTSHGPFDRVPEARRELYPKQRGKTEGYLNSMRYVDRALESYLAALPEGATIVLYGDHASGVRGYQQPAAAASNKVPWLIHRKGADWARLQSASTRPGAGGIATNLHMLDLVAFLHSSLKSGRLEPVPPNRLP
jgi:phosphoglycerol transferase MdoB-like AlkP superfamily enzyme